jgi:hypothetical protein
MNFIVRQVGQSTRGDEVRSFRQAVVRLGRRPDNDIAYDPVGDPLVSGYHAEIHASNGRFYVVDLGSSNGTFIGKHRCLPQQKIEILIGTEIRLGGEDGPRLVVEAPPGGVAAIGAAAADASEISGGVPRAALAKKSFGEQTLIRMMSQASRAERRRMLGVMILLIAVAGTIAYFAIKEEKKDGPSSTTASSREDRREDLQRHLNEARSRVYVVVRQNLNGAAVASEDPFGTAWSVRPGALATNGHVADIIREAKGRANVRFLARNSGSNDLRIVGYDIHPGWEEFQRLQSIYLKGKKSDDAAAVRTGCDVALLLIDKLDVVHQSASLPLADEAELRKLKQADPIGFSGYPLEGIGINTKQPVALVRTGDMSAMTDFFLGETSFENAHLIAFTMAGAGGASGSPVLAASGNVICLLYSGDVGGQTSVARISVAGGFTYGQRVDLLRELLDGTAAQKQIERTRAWEAQFKKISR